MKKIIVIEIVFLILILLLTENSFAQKAPIKFGKINKNDLEKEVYEIDTSAAAIILCDYGYFDDKEFKLTRTLRIKILKKEGLELGNHVFNVEEKTNIRGKTFNLENGEIVSSKLNRESIFREKVVGRFQRTRIAMPNV